MDRAAPDEETKAEEIVFLLWFRVRCEVPDLTIMVEDIVGVMRWCTSGVRALVNRAYLMICFRGTTREATLEHAHLRGVACDMNLCSTGVPVLSKFVLNGRLYK